MLLMYAYIVCGALVVFGPKVLQSASGKYSIVPGAARRFETIPSDDDDDRINSAAQLNVSKRYEPLLHNILLYTRPRSGEADPRAAECLAVA